MKHLIKLNLLTMLLIVMCAISATAHDFEVDGIYYNILNNNEVEVTYRGTYSSHYTNEYSGKVTIPETVTHNGITYSVTCINEGAFKSCSGMTSVTIPNSVTTIGDYAFCGCSGLTSIDIPNSVTEIGEEVFGSCANLSSVHLGNSVTSISQFMFNNCTSLASIDIPNSVKTIGDGAFWNCSGMTSIIVESGNPNYDSRNNCNAIIETATNTLIAGCKNTTIPNSVTCIDEGAFESCSGMTSVTIPNSVTTIGFDAFKSCSGLTSVTIPNSVTHIDDCAFESCSGMTSVTLPNSITTIGGYAFSSCSGLTNINIPNSVSYIGEGAFSGCSGLTNVIIPNSVTHISVWAFKGCNGLTYVTIPNSVTHIDDCAFESCSGLSNVTIPKSVTTIGSGAFADCSGLTSVTIPNSVTTIGYYAFYECNQLTIAFLTGDGEWTAGELPNTVTTLNIDSGLTGVKGMKQKPTDVFSFAVTPPVCDDNSFTDYSGTLHVPAASLAAYFTAPYWCNFANIVGDAVKPSGLTLDSDSLELIVQEMTTLAATISPATATSNIITWASTNPAVATIVNGEVTALSLGECDIIAICLDHQAVCHITVYSDRISVDQHEVRVLPNHMVTLTPTTLAAELPALVVTSSNPTVAAARVMNGKVQVVGITEGTTTITIGSADGTAKPATCLVTVYTEIGDVNMDGFVDVSDVTILISKVLGYEVNPFSAANANLNSDGKLDVADVTALIALILSK